MTDNKQVIQNPDELYAKPIAETILPEQIKRNQELKDILDKKCTKIETRGCKGLKGRVPETVLNDETLNQLLFDIASGLSLFKTIRKYHIGQNRYEILCNKYSDKIQQIRAEIAHAKDKQLPDKAILKMDEILDTIDQKTIKQSKLSSRTSAMNDLNNIIRLNTGKSTENINLLSKNMNDEQLREFIINGNVGVTNEK